MAKQPIMGRIFPWNGHRISRNTMAYNAPFERTYIDAGCYEDLQMVEIPGVFQRQATLEGAFTGDREEALLTALKVSTEGPKMTPLWNSVAHGQTVVVQNMRLKKATGPFAARDTLAPFNLEFGTAGDWYTGKMLLESVTGAPTGSGVTNGTGLQMGAAATGVWLCIQALDDPAITGTSPTLSVKLQSDVDNTWGSPADLIVDTSITASAAGLFLFAAVAVTDTWRRVVVTVGGTSTPTYPLLIAAGNY
jgi:hypothetical protein